MTINLGPLDIFGINKKRIGEDKQGDEEIQSYGRKYDVSPIFSFVNSGTIIAQAEVIIDFETEKPKTLKYLPFNTLNILNNSAEEIIVYINQKRDRPIKVPPNVIFPIDNTIAPSISSILWKNNHASDSISANEIQFLVSKDNVTTDLLAKRLHQIIFRGQGLTRR